MATGVSIEILDLRHFAAPMLRPVLEVEGELWKQRLHWDYRASAKLLMQYLDSRMLPGYAALDAGHIAGYAFCVYEDTKAVIGDVFALPNQLANSLASIVQGSASIQEMPGFCPGNRRNAAPASLRVVAELAPSRTDRIPTAIAPFWRSRGGLSRGRIPGLPPPLHGAGSP